MPFGTVDFWVPARREGAILTDQKERLRFTATELFGLAPGEIRRGLEVEYDPGPVGSARRVRLRRVALLTVPDELSDDDPLLKKIPLPEALRALVENELKCGRGHPGLRLDKYLIPATNQERQKSALAEVVGQSSGDPSLFDDTRKRRQTILAALAAHCWTRTTSGPLTLHLARASALENAGQCLHPIQGFAYLPGTGLKGLARAFAQTIWLPAEPDETVAKATIEHVFGRAPTGARQRDDDEGAAAGAVVFHDAWPEQWPQLIVDIVNNHHADYYQGKNAPGDWEAPTMVYFLAVPIGQRFSFALSARRDDAASGILKQAREWLDGGLTHLGCGAKTAAGYGRFAVDGERAPLPQSPRVAEFETSLTLVSPAFLAGADQTSEQDCDLRPATLRGMLRWWWRTLHAAALSAEHLRVLEAALWGDTASGSPLQIQVERGQSGSPSRYQKREKANMFPDQKVSPYGIPGADPKKTTQGLWYVSYGMDETSKQRNYLEPGAEWSVRLIARPAWFFLNRKDAKDPQQRPRAPDLTATDVLEQARAALWLLCRFGGVGSKARKGLGSLSATELDDCQHSAQALRDRLRLPAPAPGRPTQSAALEHMLPTVEVEFPWRNVWDVLDQVGFAYQTFAKRFAHDKDREGRLIPTWSGDLSPQGFTKASLGLPRRIPGRAGDGTPWSDARHASPVHVHLERTPRGYLVRAIAFPACRLPTWESSSAFLREFLLQFEAELQRRARLPVPRSSQVPASRAATPAAPRYNDRVSVKLLSEKTKKGGWIALHEPSGLSGPVQDPKNLLQGKQPEEFVTLTVASVDQPGKKIQFKAE